MLDLRSLWGSCLVLVEPPGIILTSGSRVLRVGPVFLGMHGLMGQDCSPRRPSICKGSPPPFPPGPARNGCMQERQLDSFFFLGLGEEQGLVMDLPENSLRMVPGGTARPCVL